MRDIIVGLSEVEQQLLSEVAVNSIFRLVINKAKAQAEEDLLNLPPDGPNFISEYGRLQSLRFLYQDLTTVLDELANKFYSPHQTLGEKQ